MFLLFVRIQLELGGGKVYNMKKPKIGSLVIIQNDYGDPLRARLPFVVKSYEKLMEGYYEEEIMILYPLINSPPSNHWIYDYYKKHYFLLNSLWDAYIVQVIE